MLCVLGGGFLTQIQKGMINAFLRRMYKYHFVSECFDIDSIVDDMDGKFLRCCFSQSTVYILVKFGTVTQSRPLQRTDR